MTRTSQASTKRRSIVDPRLEKPLLHLHSANDIDSFWKAIQQTIDAALPVDLTRKQRAASELLAADPMPVPETIEELKAELGEIRSGPP